MKDSMNKWFDPKITVVVAVLTVAVKGFGLSQITWTTTDLLVAVIYVVLGTLFWARILTAAKNYFDQRK